jgi:hypothetical protein
MEALIACRNHHRLRSAFVSLGRDFRGEIEALLTGSALDHLGGQGTTFELEGPAAMGCATVPGHKIVTAAPTVDPVHGNGCLQISHTAGEYSLFLRDRKSVRWALVVDVHSYGPWYGRNGLRYTTLQGVTLAPNGVARPFEPWCRAIAHDQKGWGGSPD